MAMTLTRCLRRLILIGAFALCATLLAHGLLFANQATTFFGAILLAIVFVLILIDTARPPQADPDRE